MTNKPHAFTEPLLVQLGIAGRWGTIVSGDRLPQRKPDPAPLLLAARELGLAPGSCVYIGDAPRDVEAGRAAGMKTVAAAFGYIRPRRGSDRLGRRLRGPAAARDSRSASAIAARRGRMTIDASVLLYVALAAVAGFAIGLLVGFGRSAALRRELGDKDAELRIRAAADAERDKTLEVATDRLRLAVGELTDRQFQRHSETFLKLARETLSVQSERAKGDLTAREKAIENLVQPIREALVRSERQLQELDQSRRETHGSIKAQLESLADEPTGVECRDAQSRQRAAPARSPRPVGRDHAASARGARGYGRALRLRDPESSGDRDWRDPSRHGHSPA